MAAPQSASINSQLELVGAGPENRQVFAPHPPQSSVDRAPTFGNLRHVEWWRSRRSLDWIIDDSNRASEVMGRVRALANKTAIEKVPLDINDVVRETIPLVQRELIIQRVSLRTELAPALPAVHGDRVHFQQVIINLAMNGIEAMQVVTDRPRELVIRSRQDEPQEVLVSVTDCGVGISAENADRLFNAFFTTKSSGMGMGLSICRSIMEAHGSRLWATTNVPHGATFQFTLPVNADDRFVP
jgi:signal transduction histidine kinase